MQKSFESKMATEMTSIAVLDFRGERLDPGGSKWAQLSDKVGHAVREFGCFEALLTTTEAEHQALFRVIKEVFTLPVETKKKNVYQSPFHGYNGPHGPLETMESLGIDDADSIEGVEAFANVMWPSGNADFSVAMHPFVKKLHEFSKTVIRMVMENLGVEKYYNAQVDSLECHARINRYRHPPSGAGSVPCLGSHVDSNFMTILCENEVHGLEVQTKEGEWVLFQPSLNSFIVLIGASFVAWSNGIIRAAPHRVTTSGDKVRYTMGVFLMTKEDHMVEVPDELVDETHPLVFKPFNYYEFRRFYLSNPISNSIKGCLAVLRDYSAI